MELKDFLNLSLEEKFEKREENRNFFSDVLFIKKDNFFLEKRTRLKAMSKNIDLFNKISALTSLFWQNKGWDLHTSNFLTLSEFPRDKYEERARIIILYQLRIRPWLNKDLEGEEYDKWLEENEYVVYIKPT